MGLTIFDKDSRKIYRNTIRSIRFNRDHCTIAFSNSLKDEHDGGKKTVLFARNEQGNKVEWYVCFDAGERGYKIRPRTKKRGICDFIFVNTRIVDTILDDSTKAKHSSTFFVSMNPTMIDGFKWYRIILSNPTHVK